MKDFLVQMAFVIGVPVGIALSFWLSGLAFCLAWRLVDRNHTIKIHHAGVTVWLLFVAGYLILYLLGIVDGGRAPSMPPEYYDDYHTPRF